MIYIYLISWSFGYYVVLTSSICLLLVLCKSNKKSFFIQTKQYEKVLQWLFSVRSDIT